MAVGWSRNSRLQPAAILAEFSMAGIDQLRESLQSGGSPQAGTQSDTDLKKTRCILPGTPHFYTKETGETIARLSRFAGVYNEEQMKKFVIYTTDHK